MSIQVHALSHPKIISYQTSSSNFPPKAPGITYSMILTYLKLQLKQAHEYTYIFHRIESRDYLSAFRKPLVFGGLS